MSNHTFTGRPSVDKPWLKYYSDDAIHAELPDCTMFDYLWECKLPVVFVVPKSQNASLDELREELEELCRKELPEYAQPIRWHFRENLQLTAIGKVDYRALEKMAEEVNHG